MRFFNLLGLSFMSVSLWVAPCFALGGDSEDEEENEDLYAMACMFEEAIEVTSEQMVSFILLRIAMEGDGVLEDYDLRLEDLSVDALEAIARLRCTGVGRQRGGGDARAVRLLLEARAGLNQREAQAGYGLLHIAAERGNLRVVYELMGAGVDETLTDAEGNTALAIAQEFNQTEIVRVLDRQNEQQMRLTAGMEALPLNTTRPRASLREAGGFGGPFIRVTQNNPACGR